MTEEKDWLTKRLEFIRGLPEPTDVQKLLLEMSAAPVLLTAEKKQFAALVKAERAEERAESARIAARAIVTNRAEAERKARNHRLIQLGGLVDLAGLGDVDRGALLGAMLGMAKLPADHPRWMELKREGDALLAQRAEETKARAKAKVKAADPAPGPEPVRQTDPEQGSADDIQGGQ